MKYTASFWIQSLDLESHPEGGYYKETIRPEGIKKEERASFSSILFLLKADDISHFHRIDADEVWYYHAGKSAGLTPLFIGIDQEGGAVVRMEDKLIKVPPAEELGQGSVDHAADLAKQVGTELKGLGFNINFAPDADLGLTYGRSYSTNPDQVVKFAGAVGKAYDESGLWYSYKHFPGIGKTDVDLHADTSVVPVSKDTLLAEDTKVFVDLIKQSKPNTYMIMVSHAMYPQIDPDHPSSLSKKIITDWLRKDMGYNGVVVTDDMDMGALAKHYTFGDMAVQSIQAGSDILLVCHEYEHMQEAYNGLMKAVKDGTISKERLDASVKRILLMKMNHGV